MTNGVNVSIALLKEAFTSQHYVALLQDPQTHDAARDLVAQLVAHTTNVDLIQEIVRSGLPANYSGDTIDEVPGMVEGALRRGFQNRGRSKDNSEKETIASKAIAVLTDDDVELFHDDNRKAFITVTAPETGARTFGLSSQEARHLLRSRYFDRFGSALPGATLGDVLGTLEARAIYRGQKRNVELRICRHQNSVVVDLGRPDGLTIEIDETGWRVTNDSGIRFIRPAGFGELPIPTRGGNLDSMKAVLKIDGVAWALFLAFVINAWRPGGPYFCLLLDGEQGSGKSVFCSIIKKIVDPSVIDKLPLPGSDDQLMIQAKDAHLLVFDNASVMRNDISDALCRLATRAASAKRKLYTDDDLHIMHQCRPFIVNGIGEFASRPDLLERAILLSLPAMQEGSRKTESALLEAFYSEQPAFLGCLCDIISTALKNETFSVPPPNVRMADAAVWLIAAEPATGLQSGTLLAAIAESQATAAIDRILENSLVLALEVVVRDAPFEGRVSDLFDRLKDFNERPDRSFPRTPAHLSNQLQRLRPAMAKAGLFVTLDRRTREGRRVRIWRSGQQQPPIGSEPWQKW